ncbi:MAG: hypothetical protein H6621_03495 [Halobacteriovoraceae bacterium]|nr:hypothetical protein [Halobacteriovoraceae bacterium]MCB9094112.1 hypothetical protein [Halobacteriovoraceae bacterium]
MRHIFYVDPFEKLNYKKDSSLMMALALKELKEEVYLLFDKDLYVTNYQDKQTLVVYDFSGRVKDDFYMDRMNLKNEKVIVVDKNDVFHIRIDPPVDVGYVRAMWLFEFLKEKYHCTVLNDPSAILKYNEKLVCFLRKDASPESCVGASVPAFMEFADELIKRGHEDCILKPLNSFSGYGVMKVSLLDKNFEAIITEQVEKNDGALIMQPFEKKVMSEGEYRAVYWLGEEIGTILKTPPEGSFLSNIAQGATFKRATLSAVAKKECDDMAWFLKEQGIPFVSFDVLNDKLGEVNITCPALLVEVSHAMGENIALKMMKHFSN